MSQRKIIVISSCSCCHYERKCHCTHPAIRVSSGDGYCDKPIPDVNWTIPDWCPLENAK